MAPVVLPSSRQGWLYYLSSGLVFALTLSANITAYKKAMQNSPAYTEEWHEEDFSQHNPLRFHGILIHLC